MNRSELALPALACVVATTVLAASSAGAEKPNFVFVIADDCTYRDLGCYGGQAHTPHIDRLASQGMRFTQCFQAAPMCSPTRHNIYTGLYPVKSGAYPNCLLASSELGPSRKTGERHCLQASSGTCRTRQEI